MPKPVLNIADVVLEPRPSAFAPTGEAAQRFEAKMGMIGPRIGAQKLGCNITAVPPGTPRQSSVWPAHSQLPSINPLVNNGPA